MAKKPIIGITMGDPAGNGSEISVKALADSSVYERCELHGKSGENSR